MKKILLLTFISIFSIQGAVITREGMIATANQYIPPINEWTPVVDKTSLSTKWQSEYKIKKNGGNPPYNKMPYCWSGFDTPSELKSRVERAKNPLPAGGYDTRDFDYCRDYIAGIDCSGFVIRCWGFNSYVDYQSSLLNYALEIEEEALKQGDLLRKSGHSIMYVSGPLNNCNIYESQARGEDIAPYYPGVTNIRRNISDDYTPYSIFPQFSDESPEDGELVDLPEGETTIDISLTIKASGDINTTGVRMFIQKDGESEKNIGDVSLDKKGDNTWELKKEDFDVSEGGNFTVKVIATENWPTALGLRLTAWK